MQRERSSPKRTEQRRGLRSSENPSNRGDSLDSLDGTEERRGHRYLQNSSNRGDPIDYLDQRPVDYLDCSHPKIEILIVKSSIDSFQAQAFPASLLDDGKSCFGVI